MGEQIVINFHCREHVRDSTSVELRVTTVSFSLELCLPVSHHDTGSRCQIEVTLTGQPSFNFSRYYCALKCRIRVHVQLSNTKLFSVTSSKTFFPLAIYVKPLKATESKFPVSVGTAQSIINSY